MAKYTITHCCGHESSLTLFGKTSEREWKIQSEEGRVCSECFKEAKIQERKEAGDRAAEMNIQLGCVPLQDGTEKQIAWGETIRFRRIDALVMLIRQSEDRAPQSAVIGEALAVMEKTLDWARSIESAQWWIENRDQYQTEADEMQRFQSVLAVLGGRRPRPVEPGNADLVKGLLLASPHLTLATAEAMNLATEWKKRQESLAEKAAKEEQDKKDAPLLRTKESAREKARAIGIKGSVKVWKSACGDHKRIYADDFTFFAVGKEAGKLENKSSLPDSIILEYAKTLSAAWNSLSFYA